MSAAINYVMGRLLGRGNIDINRRILEVGFRDDWLESRAPATLESKILNWVIRDRVIMDMDLVTGEEILVDLSGINPWTSDDFARIYNIPPEVLNFREIMSVLTVSYIPFGRMVGQRSGGSISAVPMYNNDIMVAGQQVFNSVTAIPNVSTARAELVGFNMVRVTDRQRLQPGYVLRCYVTSDSTLQNLNPRLYPKFFQLCLLAIKAYLYQKLFIEMGDHYLQRGQELGVFKETIGRWESAAEEYETFRSEEWDVIMYMNDEDAHTRFLQLQIPIGL